MAFVSGSFSSGGRSDSFSGGSGRRSSRSLRRLSEATSPGAQLRKGQFGGAGSFSWGSEELSRRSSGLPGGPSDQRTPCSPSPVEDRRSRVVPRFSAPQPPDAPPKARQPNGDGRSEQLKQEYLDLLEDLVGDAPEQKNWRGLLLALVTIMFVFALVGVAVLALQEEGPEMGLVALEIDHVTAGGSNWGLQAHWLSSSSFALADRGGGIKIWKRRQQSGNFTVHLNLRDDISLAGDLQAWQFCPRDGDLLAVHVLKNRASKLLVYNVTSEKFENTVSSEGVTSFAWANDKLIYVTEHGLELLSVDGSVITLKNSSQALTYGKANSLYRDFVWGSERPALWASPGGGRVVFPEFDDSRVPTVPVMRFSLEGTQVAQVPYPKVNDPISRVSLHLLPSDSNQTTNIFQGGVDEYLVCFTWLTDDVAKSEWTSRDRSLKRVLLHRFHPTPVTDQLDMTGARFDPMSCTSAIMSDKYLDFVGVSASKHSLGHITISDPADITPFVAISSDDLTDIEIIVHEVDRALFLASPSATPEQRHLYSTDGTRPNQKCLTCGLPCSNWVSATFYDDSMSLLLKCIGREGSWTFRGTILKSLNFLRVQQELSSTPSPSSAGKLRLPRREYLTIKLGESSNRGLRCLVIWPPSMDPGYRYPLLVHATPEFPRQTPTISFLDYLASRGVIVAVPFLGDWDSFGVLGDTSVSAITATIDHLVGVGVGDSSRTAILTSELGALAASKVAEESAISCLSLMRPVTNLSNYHAFVSEKSNDTKEYQLDPKSVTKTATEILLIQALDDEKVLFENSGQLLKLNTPSSSTIHSQVYTSLPRDSSDFLLDGHVMQTLNDFLQKCLRVETPA